MADKATAQEPVATEENVDTGSILRELLGEIKSLREQNSKFEAELAAQRAVAEQKAVVVDDRNDDPYRPNAAPPGMIDPRTDHPERNIDRKLDAMANLAAENGQQFDRERTKRVLLGLPVEDLNKFVYNGHAFDTEAEMEAYKEKVESEKLATIGKYLR